jgi:hypothetical protein
MPNAAGLNFGIAFLVAGFLFLVMMAIFLYRFRQIRLRVTFLRSLVPMLFAIICLAQAFAIFDERSGYAHNWYRVIAIAIVAGQLSNLVFLTYIVYGPLSATTGTLATTLAGLNIILVLANEHLSVLLSPQFGAFYPVMSLIFYVTNQLLGIVHGAYNMGANFRVMRRHDILPRTKRKFLLFTLGISAMYVSFTIAILVVIFFPTADIYFWSVIGCYVSLVCLYLGLFYANPSVFYLPTRLYLLVVFRGGAQGEILYEKHFNQIQSTNAQLVGPAVASIADLVQKSFQQSKRLRLFSLPGRKLLYEWGDNIGAVLIVDKEISIFRNCLRLVLKEASLLPVEKSRFDARVTEIFSFYINEQRE